MWPPYCKVYKEGNYVVISQGFGILSALDNILGREPISSFGSSSSETVKPVLFSCGFLDTPMRGKENPQRFSSDVLVKVGGLFSGMLGIC